MDTTYADQINAKMYQHVKVCDSNNAHYNANTSNMGITKEQDVNVDSYKKKMKDGNVVEYKYMDSLTKGHFYKLDLEYQIEDNGTDESGQEMASLKYTINMTKIPKSKTKSDNIVDTMYSES